MRVYPKDLAFFRCIANAAYMLGKYMLVDKHKYLI